MKTFPLKKMSGTIFVLFPTCCSGAISWEKCALYMRQYVSTFLGLFSFLSFRALRLCVLYMRHYVCTFLGLFSSLSFRARRLCVLYSIHYISTFLGLFSSLSFRALRLWLLLLAGIFLGSG